MLDIGFSEVLLIFIIALIVLGPEKLPQVVRQVGRWVGRARAMARQFREQLEEEVTLEENRKAQSSAQRASAAPPQADASVATGATTSAGAAATGAAAPTPPPPATPAAAPPDPAASVDSNQSGHVDLSDQPWPYAPPPEVAEVLHDALRPVPEAQPTEVTRDSGADTRGSASAAVNSPETQKSPAAVSGTHERGT
jgi:sec-independent protein translocase protein TatB